MNQRTPATCHQRYQLPIWGIPIGISKTKATAMAALLEELLGKNVLITDGYKVVLISLESKEKIPYLKQRIPKCFKTY